MLDGEPRYEDHPINWKPANGWFDECDVRQAAYWSMLAGACGHTYGDHNIWQMWQPGRQPISSARTPWREALDHPGSAQMGLMRRLFEAVAWQKLVPDQSLLTCGTQINGPEHLRAARANDGSFAVIYTPYWPARAGEARQARRRGAAPSGSIPRPARSAPRNAKGNTFDPPGEPGRGNDWVLVGECLRRDEAPDVRIPWTAVGKSSGE